MKKLYYIIVGIVIIIFGYWIISYMPTFFSQLSTITSHSIDTSSFSTTGTFGFKSTPERLDLVTEMVNINSQFIKNPPVSFNTGKVDIKNFHELEKLFPDFKYYYIAKLKVKEAIFNQLPLLYKDTSSLSDNALKGYFEENTDYLKEKWGLDNFSDFYDLVLTIRQLNTTEISSYELENSYFTLPTQGSINFRIIITPKDGSPIPLAVKTEVYNSTTYQSSPVIRIYGTALGGVS